MECAVLQEIAANQRNEPLSAQNSAYCSWHADTDMADRYLQHGRVDILLNVRVRRSRDLHHIDYRQPKLLRYRFIDTRT